jgi:hypothetical protein
MSGARPYNMSKDSYYSDMFAEHVHAMDMFEAAVKNSLKALGHGG